MCYIYAELPNRFISSAVPVCHRGPLELSSDNEEGSKTFHGNYSGSNGIHPLVLLELFLSCDDHFKRFEAMRHKRIGPVIVVRRRQMFIRLETFAPRQSIILCPSVTQLFLVCAMSTIEW